MKINRLVRAASISAIALLLMASSASAATITFFTDGSATGFGGPAILSLSSATGGATLVFTPNGVTAVTVPSNINYGDFILSCPSCTDSAGGVGAHFNPFTFDMVISDVTDGATGKFTGTSTGGDIFLDVSPITIHWVPALLGPGSSNALTGSFGPTTFDINQTTRIVAPNTGGGQTTVQGSVTSASVPEPATMSLLAIGLVGFSLFGRKRALSQ